MIMLHIPIVGVKQVMKRIILHVIPGRWACGFTYDALVALKKGVPLIDFGLSVTKNLSAQKTQTKQQPPARKKTTR